MLAFVDPDARAVCYLDLRLVPEPKDGARAIAAAMELEAFDLAYQDALNKIEQA